MNALLIALLTAGSTFAAVFPLMKTKLARPAIPVIEVAATKACRHQVITVIRPPRNHRGAQWCGSTRKRPCIRRR